MKETPRFGHGTTVPRRRKSALSRARSVGIAGHVEALQLALAAMIGGYDQLLATTPKSSHAVIEGAFGASPELARAILEAV